MLRIMIVLCFAFIVTETSAAEPAIHLAGEWRSAQSGHHGPMHAKLTPTAEGYDLRVVGRFAAIIPFTYRTHLEVVGTTPEGPILAAEKKLPLFGGSFRTSGILTANGFTADYSAMKDSGRFTLARRR